MEEKTFFDSGGVTVTNARFVVHGQTYAMQSVTSIKGGKKGPPRVGPIVVGVLGLVAFSSWGVGGVVLGLCLLAIAVYWWIQQKPTLIVLLSSASGEAQALSSNDAPYIQQIIGALNDALIHRG
jgi:hypothetical protein